MSTRAHLEYYEPSQTRVTCMKTQLIGVDRWINQQTGEIIEAQTIAREVKEVDIGFEALDRAHS